MASTGAPGTTPTQPQMVTRGGNTSNSTPMRTSIVSNNSINISSTITYLPIGTVPSSNPGGTSTSYTSIPTTGCTLPNMCFPYGGVNQGQNSQGVNLSPFIQTNPCLGSTSGGNPTLWNGNIPSGGNGPWNMNTNWRNHPQMSGNVSGGYPPTNPSTISRGNPTPPTTTMPGGIPPMNLVLSSSSMGFRSNQYFGNLPP